MEKLWNEAQQANLMTWKSRKMKMTEYGDRTPAVAEGIISNTTVIGTHDLTHGWNAGDTPIFVVHKIILLCPLYYLLLSCYTCLSDLDMSCTGLVVPMGPKRISVQAAKMISNGCLYRANNRSG